MPLPDTQVPAYPNVPNAPGVPPLVRQAGAVQSTVVALAADGATVLALFQGPQWGLFTAAGAPAFAGPTGSNILNVLAGAVGISGQSVLEVEYAADNPISSAPQEQGAFASYNKVARPYTGRVTYAVSGLQSFRTAFIQTCETLRASLALMSLMMPEFTYQNCNVIHYSVHRQEKKPTLLIVEIWVEEVRVVGTAAFSNSATASPAGADPVSDGTVQAQPLTPSQTSSLPAGPDTTDAPGTGGTGGAGQAPALSGTGGDSNSTVGVATAPYYDANGNQIGLAPAETAPSGQIVGSSAPTTTPAGNTITQPVFGGAWQNGFYDTNGTWITQGSGGSK